MKHLICINDLSIDDINSILKLSEELKLKQKNNIIHNTLQGKTLGMIFSKSSTRTRVSFEVGMYQLGGYPMFLSSNDVQLGRGESIYDTSKVLSRYLDGIMIRTFKQEDVIELAQHSTIPVINGLTDLDHPCQILADLFTIFEKKKTLMGLKLAYLGDGNNVANSLLHGLTKVGMHISVASPKKYKCSDSVINAAIENSKQSGSKIVITDDPIEAVKDADVIYTDTWVSMGQESQKEEKIKDFSSFQVNDEIVKHAKKDYIFLHCLPAYRGYEVTTSIIDGPNSLIFEEAENRLHVQKAILTLLMGEK